MALRNRAERIRLRQRRAQQPRVLSDVSDADASRGTAVRPHRRRHLSRRHRRLVDRIRPRDDRPLLPGAARRAGPPRGACRAPDGDLSLCVFFRRRLHGKPVSAVHRRGLLRVSHAAVGLGRPRRRRGDRDASERHPDAARARLDRVARRGGSARPADGDRRTRCSSRPASGCIPSTSIH